MEFSKTNEIIYTFLWGVRGDWDIRHKLKYLSCRLAPI